MTKQQTTKQDYRIRRHKRVRTRIAGTPARPRLAVFRSNKYVAAQLIDDTNGTTLASATSKTTSGKTSDDRARAVGSALAKQAHALKIERVVFDRGGFLYRGKVRLVAEGARKAGLVF